MCIRDRFKGIQQVDDRYTVIHLDNFINKEGFYLIRDTETNRTTYQIIDKESEITAEFLKKWFE